MNDLTTKEQQVVRTARRHDKIRRCLNSRVDRHAARSPRGRSCLAGAVREHLCSINKSRAIDAQRT